MSFEREGIVVLRGTKGQKVPLWGTLTSRDTQQLMVQFAHHPEEQVAGVITIRAKQPFSVSLVGPTYKSSVVKASPHVDGIYQVQMPFRAAAKSLAGDLALQFSNRAAGEKLVVSVHIYLSQEGKSAGLTRRTSKKQKGSAASNQKKKKQQKGKATGLNRRRMGSKKKKSVPQKKKGQKGTASRFKRGKAAGRKKKRGCKKSCRGKCMQVRVM